MRTESTLLPAATHTTPKDWTPKSWKSRPIVQAPPYTDNVALESASDKLGTLPPLVTSWEVERLRGELAEAALGRRFVLQAGDCAETFQECTPAYITNKLKILLQMSLLLTDGLKRPIVRIGRIAGQYAKPRSSPMETINGKTLLSYYGDLINGPIFNDTDRAPDPQRLLLSYYHSAMTLNFVRSLIDGGFADLHHPEYWDLNFLDKAGLTPEMRANYLRRVDSIANAIEVMEIIAGQPIDKVGSVDFYTSHEGLSLPYESALTRKVPRREGYYNLGCHLPWIGERTRQLDGAHIEFFRGIRNPVGIKIGPKTTAADLLGMADAIDPTHEAGRLVFICRFGQGKPKSVLPPLVEAMRNAGRAPVWICDPMHGNTVSTSNGKKTRHLDAIQSELIDTIEVHESLQSVLGGIHLELTAENVTECLGGASGLKESDLDIAYQSLCDPRLNYEQAMETAFLVARRMEA
ncbi:MAG: 3-deoxy-7-phosphoheptulonate synthase class II [Candidatus Sumerlaeota bacterium]